MKYFILIIASFFIIGCATTGNKPTQPTDETVETIEGINTVLDIIGNFLIFDDWIF